MFNSAHDKGPLYGFHILAISNFNQHVHDGDDDGDDARNHPWLNYELSRSAKKEHSCISHYCTFKFQAFEKFLSHCFSTSRSVSEAVFKSYLVF